jgi:hypothetical protein
MESILDLTIRNPTTKLPDEAPTRCPKCLLTFQVEVHGNRREIQVSVLF